MDTHFHRLCELFAQLGLPDDAGGIGHFIAQHAPLAAAVRLEDAPFWTETQAQFLREAPREDSDWAGVADHLNAALRSG